MDLSKVTLDIFTKLEQKWLSPRKTRILSIDGGGTTAIVAGASILHLEDQIRLQTGDPHAQISDFFDIVAGTGIGGILAALLVADDGSGKPMFTARDTVRFISEKNSELFEIRHTGVFRRNRRCSAGSMDRALEAAFRREDGKVLTMKDTCKPLLVPCYDLRSSAPFVFSRAGASESPSFDFELWKVCRATSATPSLFKPVNVVSVDGKTSCLAVDGGLVMNNPSAAAVTHVLHNKRDFPSVNGVDDLLVLSLGNGSSSSPGGKLRRNGDCSTSCVVDIVTDGVSDTVDQMLGNAFCWNRTDYVRIQVSGLTRGGEGIVGPRKTAEELLKERGVETAPFGGKRLLSETNGERIESFVQRLVASGKSTSLPPSPWGAETKNSSLQVYRSCSKEKLEVGEMEDQCMVMCGEWVCGNGGKWDFVLDKRQMGRLVPLYEGMSLKELQGNVLREFGVDEGLFAASLSYWPPSSLELATGLRTPPVLLTSDGAIRFFLQHLRVKGAMNLFVGFVKNSQDKDEFIDDSGMGFVTPVPLKPKGPLNVGIGSSRRSFVSSKAPKPPVVNLEDIEFVREVERVEEEINGGSAIGKEPTLSGSSLGEDYVGGSSLGEDYVGGSSLGEDYVVDEVDVRDVRPRGYDQEFWSPLLHGDFGGSNAVNVIYNEDEIVDNLTKKSGPYRYTCTTNDAFDHVVEVGGTSNVKTDYGGDKHPWMGGSSYNPWMGGNQDVDRGSQRSTRKLDEVDDEEFDIPPLFDDTSYAAAEIPDMDLEEGDGRIYVGKVFGNKEDCQISLAIYAIRNQFRFKQTRTKVDSFVVECPDERCDWRVTAHEMKGCGYYEIRKAQLDHSCPIEFRQGYQSRATSRVIAAVYKSKFGDPGKGPVPTELQKLVLEDLRVSASYMKCYRAKEKAVIGIQGSDEDSYLKLPEYLHMLKLANPGTVADIETEVDDDGDERFLYLFLAFGASIRGFKKLRLVLVVDGTHLGGKYKGVLLTASGQDANFQIFPLAYAIVDSEDEEAWTWFLMKVERILGDSPRLAIISDRATCIATAVKRVYPSAKHGYCIVHLARNVNSRYSSKNLAKMVTATATAYRQRDYRDLYSKVRAQRSDCGVYLGGIGVAHWSRANFPGDRYNIMTSNIAEQLNHALVEGRTSPIMELVIFIQRMMTRWFSARRKKAEKHRGMVSVEVDKEMTKNMATMKGSKVNSSTEWSCEIIGKFGGKERVHLRDKQCSCKYFDKIKIPCGHAMMAADSLGVPYDTLVGHWYKTSTWRETYAGVISPEGDPHDVDVPEEVKKMVLFPPVTKRQPGRRRKTRIPSIGEFPVTKKTKLVPNKCGRCRMEGHNRSSCKNPI